MILFPRKAGVPKKGDATAEEVKEAQQIVKLSESAFKINPIPTFGVVGERKIEASEKEQNAFRTLRVARADKRNAGKREKRRKAAEDEAAAKKK